MIWLSEYRMLTEDAGQHIRREMLWDLIIQVLTWSGEVMKGSLLCFIGTFVVLGVKTILTLYLGYTLAVALTNETRSKEIIPILSPSSLSRLKSLFYVPLYVREGLIWFIYLDHFWENPIIVLVEASEQFFNFQNLTDWAALIEWTFPSATKGMWWWMMLWTESVLTFEWWGLRVTSLTSSESWGHRLRGTSMRTAAIWTMFECWDLRSQDIRGSWDLKLQTAGVITSGSSSLSAKTTTTS